MKKSIHFKVLFRLLLAINIILITANESKSQLRQVYLDSQADNEINSISFYSPSAGYVAFTDWIGYTTDSGRTFTKKYITRTNVDLTGYSVNLTFGFSIKGVKAFDQNALIAYGDYGLVPAILYSKDGGNTFKLVYQFQFAFVPNGGITDMIFPQNDNIGYAVDVDQILKTTDKGITWSAVSTDPNSCFDRLTSVDDNTVFAISDYYTNDIYSSNDLPFANNKILKTTNGGSSWQTLNVPQGDIKNANFLTGTNGWVNVDINLFQTTNAGGTWTQKNNSDATPFYGGMFKFFNDSTGFALNGFEIMKTSDSGKIWENLPRDNNYSYLNYGHNDLQLLTASQLWAGGGHGFLEMSTNGGGTPLPKAYFNIDTSGVGATHKVNLINYSRQGYQYEWYVNNTLISNSYNASYSHNIYSSEDSIKLIVKNGSNSDAAIKYQYFNPAIPPAPPTVTSFSPSSGYASSSVTITGTNFVNVTAVTFGGVAAQSFNINSSTTIKAVVGTGASGNISVTNHDGKDSLSGFTFIPPPVISSFTPTSGPSGTIITINGSGFNGATAVTFGDEPAASFTVVSPTLVKAILGSGSSGNVVITSPYGTASSPGFIFNSPPYVTDVNPYFGVKGDTITITGGNFIGTTSVTFGDTAAAAFKIISSTTIAAVLGPGATGNVNVISPYGKGLMGGFYYKYPPVISSFTPSSAGAGTLVTIDGSGFEFTGTKVNFGGVPATSVNFVSPTEITAIVGSGASGDLSVTTIYGIDSLSGFKWLPPPVISSFTPISGTAGTIVTIKGSNFNNVSNINFGGSSASSINMVSSTTITAVVGLGSSGSVSVTTPGGIGSKDGFTFISSPPPTITSFSPTQGPAGITVTITGTNFNPDAAGNTVYFGTVKAAVTAASPTSLTVIAPSGANYLPLTVTSFNLTASAEKSFIITFNGSDHFSTNSFTRFEDSLHLTKTATPLICADINGDGKPDLIVPNGMQIFINTSTGGHLSFKTINFPQYSSYYASVGDFDGDGKIDLVCTSNISGSNLTLLRNTSTVDSISFQPTYWNCSVSPLNIAIGDMDGDGKPDLVINGNNNGADMAILVNTTSGSTITFGPEKLFSNYSSSAVSLADIDGDGKLDILGSGNYTVSVLRNTSTVNALSFAPEKDFKTVSYVDAFSTGDMDGDGKTDIINTKENGSSILRNTSVGDSISFAPEYILPTFNATTFGVSVCDLNGDGKPDVVVDEYWFIDSVDVFKNNSTPGNLSFEPKICYGTGTFPYGVVTGDLNGDGKPDIAVTSNLSGSSAQNLLVYLNNMSPEIKICPGSTSRIASDKSGGTYQWQQNSGSGFVNVHDNSYFSGTSSDTLVLNNIPKIWNGYQYRCLVDGVNYSTSVVINNSGPDTPSVIIIASDTTICSGSSVTFTANPLNGGASPLYQWKINDSTFTSTVNSTLMSSSLHSGDKVTVAMTSSATCITEPVATSNIITMDVNLSVEPKVSIKASSDVICAGANITFTATPVNGGSSPSYQWKKNGENIGSNSNNYITNTLQNGDLISVTLKSNATCSVPSTANSNTIAVNFTSVIPSISIKGITALQADSSSIIYSSITNGGSSPLYQWQDSTSEHSWLSIAGGSDPIIKYTAAESGDKLMCMLTSNATCSTTSTAVSNVLSFTIVIPENNGIKIYPNPVNSILTIDNLANADEWSTLQIVNIDGTKIILSQNIYGLSKVSLNVTALQSGTYIIILRGKQGKVAYLRFVKM